MENTKPLEQLPSRSELDEALTDNINSGEGLRLSQIDDILSDISAHRLRDAAVDSSDTPEVDADGYACDQDSDRDSWLDADALTWADGPNDASLNSDSDSIRILPDPSLATDSSDDNFKILNDGKSIKPYEGDLSFLDKDDFTIPQDDENSPGNTGDDNIEGLYEGDLSFLDEHNFEVPARTDHENDHSIDQLIAKKLDEARSDLAELSVKLRGKHTKLNRKLKQDYQIARDRYSTILSVKAQMALSDLKFEGASEDEIKQFALVGIAQDVIEERRAFTAAELEAYSRLNPKVGKVAKRWAEYGIVKKVLIGGGVGFASTALLPAVLATAGVGASVLAAGALSGKAAKTIGMYKLNKSGKYVEGFDKKAKQDEVFANEFVSRNLKNTENHIDNLAEHTSEAMATSIDLRIEHDQRSNKRRLAVVIGGIAAGAALGMLAGNLWDNRNGSGSTNKSVGRPGAADNKPSSSHQGVPDGDGSSLGHNRPNMPERPDPTDQTPAGSGDNVTPPVTPAPTPEVPTEIVETNEIPDFGLDRMSWEVAHDFAPGQESAFMQRGIDMYNQTNGTHFALTPHNGSTWIIDNGHAINPAQMAEMNRMMVVAFADELPETA